MYDASVTFSRLWLAGGGQGRVVWDGTGWMDASCTATAFAKAKLSDEDVIESQGIWGWVITECVTGLL